MVTPRVRSRRAGMLFSTVFFLALVFRAAALSQNAPAAIMTEVRGLALADRMEYTVLVTGVFRLTQSELREPHRLVLDMEPAETRWTPRALPGEAFGVLAVRASQFTARTVRLVFVLAEEEVSFSVRLTGEGLKVIFQKGQKPAPSQAAPPPAQPQAGPTKAPGVKPPAKAPGPVRGLPPLLAGASVAFHSLSEPRFIDISGDRQGYGYGLESVLVFARASRLRPGLGVDYERLVKSGSSTISHTGTKLILEPVTISGYVMWDTHPVVPFFAAGVCFFHYGEKSTLRDTDGSVTGLSLQAGTFFHWGQQDFFKMKIFGRWTKATARENEREFELGGTSLGLSFLFGFF